MGCHSLLQGIFLTWGLNPDPDPKLGNWEHIFSFCSELWYFFKLRFFKCSVCGTIYLCVCFCVYTISTYSDSPFLDEFSAKYQYMQMRSMTFQIIALKVTLMYLFSVIPEVKYKFHFKSRKPQNKIKQPLSDSSLILLYIGKLRTVMSFFPSLFPHVLEKISSWLADHNIESSLLCDFCLVHISF